jgi:hypothetical protein
MTYNSFWDAATASLQASAQNASLASYNLWQMPVAYWQTVSSIMGLRSNTAQNMQHLWANCCTQLTTCKTPTQVAQCLQTYQQQATLCLTQLNLQTHQYRAELWRNCQILAQRSNTQATQAEGYTATANINRFAGPNIKPVTTQPAPTFATAQAAAPAAPAPTYLKGWFVPTAQKSQTKPQIKPQIKPNSSAIETAMLQPQPEPQPAPTAAPTQIEPKIEQKAQVKPQPEPKPQPKSEPSLPLTPEPIPVAMAVGQSFSSATSTISSTAESVMRSSSGATVASAAATRRSVLARHASRKGRLGRR